MSSGDESSTPEEIDTPSSTIASTFETPPSNSEDTNLSRALRLLEEINQKTVQARSLIHSGWSGFDRRDIVRLDQTVDIAHDNLMDLSTKFLLDRDRIERCIETLTRRALESIGESKAKYVNERYKPNNVRLTNFMRNDIMSRSNRERAREAFENHFKDTKEKDVEDWYGPELSGCGSDRLWRNLAKSDMEVSEVPNTQGNSFVCDFGPPGDNRQRVVLEGIDFSDRSLLDHLDHLEFYFRESRDQSSSADDQL